jgi:hypothetical protein
MPTMYSTFYDINGAPHSYISSGYTGSVLATTGSAGSTLSALNQTYAPIGLGYSGAAFWAPITTIAPSGITGSNHVYISGGTGSSPQYKIGPGYIETIMNNIPNIGTKIIPRDSKDVITFEDINEGDILINFNRYENKTEYDCGAYYKESSLKSILESKKNQFTMKELDLNSFTKYEAKF